MTAAPLLPGETALVTGAASGIGRAIAIALAREGARVALADIDAAKGGTAVEALASKGHPAVFIEADLARPGAADRLFDDALARLGRVSLLVHSASPRRREQDTVFAVSDETWAEMVGVNLEAAFRLGRRAGAHMKEQGIKGRMLFITSLHAESPRNLPHYSAAKAGMTMVMKELARALGPAGIRVNALAPGAVAGGGFVANPAMAQKIALGRLGAPEDIAPMAVALLADRFSGYVTGTTVVVDGGIALHNWIDPPSS
jgi:NAD(P)-dependent dehydrogenase (short-subunit alcohol dehydrogenase family)